MSKLRVVLVSALMLVGTGFVTPASAVTMHAVYQGTVSDSQDQFNLFEQGGGSSLDGLSYLLTFIYDPATLGGVRETDSSSDQVEGGPGHGPGSVNPIQSATLVIGGHSELIIATHFGRATIFNDVGDGGSTAYSTHENDDYFDDGVTLHEYSIFDSAYDTSQMVPPNLDLPYQILNPLRIFGNNFSFRNYDYASLLYTTNTFGSLIPTSLTVTRVEAVPLPAALPLFFAGFGAMGFMGWRKKGKAA